MTVENHSYFHLAPTPSGAVSSFAGPCSRPLACPQWTALSYRLWSSWCPLPSLLQSVVGNVWHRSSKVDVENGWLVVKPGRVQLHPLSPSLGAGESDSIRFALEAPESSLLIMDDRLARRYALHRGLNIVGTVRLLDLAEKRGVIESAERCIQSMSDFDYRVSNDLLKIIRSE